MLRLAPRRSRQIGLAAAIDRRVSNECAIKPEVAQGPAEKFQVSQECFHSDTGGGAGVPPNRPAALLERARCLCVNSVNPGDEQRFSSAWLVAVQQTCAIDLQNSGNFFT